MPDDPAEDDVEEATVDEAGDPAPLPRFPLLPPQAAAATTNTPTSSSTLIMFLAFRTNVPSD
jgi:hypothetical protein